MRPSALRRRLSGGLLDFAWDEWAQMGVLASPRRRSPWARDPEALIVFTLEVARDDPRLFDEVLFWISGNDHLLSTWRLRAMCSNELDRRLVDGALGWVGRHKGQARGGSAPVDPPHETELLFRGLSGRIADPDRSFAAVGLLRSTPDPDDTARPPDVRLPSNLAFRLRQLLGVGVRSEIVRCLLTAETDSVAAAAVARASGFSSRNVREAVQALNEAGVVDLLGGGRQQRYAIHRDSWMRLLAIDDGELPTQREWPELLGGLRMLLRWLGEPSLDDASPYLLGSMALDLLDGVKDDFKQAGIPIAGAAALEAWRAVEGLVDRALRVLAVAHDVRTDFPPVEDLEASLPGLNVYEDGAGGYLWAFDGGDQGVFARSAGSFSSRNSALRAAQLFVDLAESWRYEIYAEAGAGFRWRAKASNGETVAVSSEAFITMSAAERATHALRSSIAN